MGLKLEQEKKPKLSIKVQPEEKKLYIRSDDEDNVVGYDFSFTMDHSTHYMCFSTNKLYVLEYGDVSEVVTLKLYPNDVLMILEKGNYDFTEVRRCNARDHWFYAYSNWLAEKELLGG